MRDLIQQYKESLKKVRAAKERVKDRTITINGVEVDVYAEEERRILSGMGGSLQFCIKWMETGRMPGSRRGAERRAAYEREWPADPFRMETAGKYFRPVGAVYTVEPVSNYEVEEPEIDADDLETIRLFLEDILSCLSEREREVFEMRHVGGLEYHEIAEELGISVDHVNNALIRAKNKIEAWKRGEL